MVRGSFYIIINSRHIFFFCQNLLIHEHVKNDLMSFLLLTSHLSLNKMVEEWIARFYKK